MTGGAVKAACEAVRDELAALGAQPGDADALAAVLAERPVEATVEWHHRQTFPLDERGQGDAHLQFAFSVHRAGTAVSRTSRFAGRPETGMTSSSSAAA